MTALSVAPLLGVAIMVVLSNAFGCRVDESGFSPCVRGGFDYGPLFYAMAMGGWAMMFTLPLLGLTLVLWLAVGLAMLVRRTRRRAGP